MILWDEEKNQKLLKERNISFEDILEIILNEEFIDILENKSRREQKLFIVNIRNYIYAVPFLIDENDNIILKTIYPSRKFYKKYGDKK